MDSYCKTYFEQLKKLKKSKGIINNAYAFQLL